MKKAKPAKHNTSEPKRDTSRQVEGRYDWSKMADLLRKSTCRSIERWYLSVGIPRQTYWDAVNREECMREAHQYTLERIGCEREELCLDKNLSSNTVAAQSLSHFLDRWKQDAEWRSKLKNVEDDKKQNITVVIPPFEPKQCD